MKILITGICGFVGSSLARFFLETGKGYSVAGVDNLMRPGSEMNRRRLRDLGVEFHHGDIRAASDFEGLPRADWVIDAAANPSVLAGTQGGFSSRQLFEHNLSALVNVLEYCKACSAGLVLLSSSRVYSIPALVSLPLLDAPNSFRLDPAADLPKGASERGIGVEFSTQAPVSLYGGMKLAAEAVALEYGAAFDFPVWIDRCGVLAGAGQFGTSGQGVFSYWINAHLRRRPLRYIGFGGAGKQVRDAFHPRDLGALIDRQIGSGRVAGQRVYTSGGGPANSMSLAELTAWCDRRFGVHQPDVDSRPRPFDVPWLVLDSHDAERDFDWRVETSLEDLLSEIAFHAESNPDWLALSGL